MNKSFSSIVIGDGSLPIHCSETLLRHGCSISAIVSSDRKIKEWAVSKGIEVVTPGADLAEQLEPTDYLFSIVNEHILDSNVLGLAGTLAINYHDAPLPRYAGTHATSWAIMNGESTHGITWHVITDVVDAGEILKQRSFPLDRSETALTLNTRCYEAAIAAFDELIQDLKSGHAEAQAQDLDNRTFFPRFKRPDAGGVISWNKSALEISQLFRALAFGNHPNPLGTAKLFIDPEFFIISELEVRETFSGERPGTILDLLQNSMMVSTGDLDVLISGLCDLHGRPVAIAEIAAKFNLQKGDRLSDIDTTLIGEIENFQRTNSKNEMFWVRKLSTLETAEISYLIDEVSPHPEYREQKIELPQKFLDLVKGEQPSILLAIFSSLISRLSGFHTFDIGFSSPSLTRSEPRLSSLLASQVPMRIDVDEWSTVWNLQRSLKAKQAKLEQRSLYFKDVVARYPELTSLTSHPFSIAVVLTDGSLASGPVLDNGLVLQISDVENIECNWVYDQLRISPDNIDRLTNQFEMMIASFCDDEDAPIKGLSILNKEEFNNIVYEWNKTHFELSNDGSIHKLIEQRASEKPDAIAVVHRGEQITYANLNKVSQVLGEKLNTMGAGRGRIVAVCMERSINAIIGMLGILKSGAAYLPLDPAYPNDRLSFMLDDADVSAIICDEQIMKRLPVDRYQTVCLGPNIAVFESTDEHDELPPVASEDIAYVIYTSGSTGKPKGVEIRHDSLLNLVDWHRRTYELSSNDRATVVAGPAFDASVWEIWPYLANGSTLYIPDDETRSTPRKLIQWMADQRITMSFLPTPLAEELIQAEIPNNLALRCLLTGGDRLHPVTRSLPFDVINHYGPTENTVVATSYKVRCGSTGLPPIGKPIANVRTYILDASLRVVPVGVPGQLFIAGDSLAKGYLNRPGLTSERFIHHSLDAGLDERLYATGDKALYNPNGEISFLDRLDDQVKIRGFRIELGEIETSLSSDQRVKNCAVIACDDSHGGKRLIAFCVPGPEYASAALREDLKLKLPDYMVPSAFVELTELPLTPNGKIDRKALPIPELTSRASSEDLVAHRDDVEFRLTQIWQDILDVRPIGIHDNFFDLGGHSLQAVRMFARVEEEFSKSIPLATLFEAGTIERLANILREGDWTERESSIVPIQPYGSRPPFFCIHAKGGNVLFYRDLAKHLGPDQPFYGVQARRLGGRQVGHSTVEEMAEFYINEMRTVQPQGPYYVGGSSFGGLAAFEIAQQLVKMGEQVGLLALLDTGTPTYPQIMADTSKVKLRVLDLVGRAQQHRDALRQFNSGERRDYIYQKLAKVKLKYRRKLNNNYKKFVRSAFVKIKGEGSIPSSYIQLEDQIWSAGQNYVPKPYPGKMTLFRATTQPAGIIQDPTLGWQGLPAELEIHDVTGHHGSIVTEPYVRELAAKLEGCIDIAMLNGQDVGSPMFSENGTAVRTDPIYDSVSV